jgi:predicted transcriptional regulator of viral defense system
MRRASLESWIDALQARGRYTFLREEAMRDSGLSATAVRKALQRAVKSGRLVRPKEYFFVIVPLEYRSAGGPPPSWFVADLMAAMRLPYYVALLSAAAIHGAAPQPPQEFQVMTDRTVRSIGVGRSHIRFFASRYLQRAATLQVKTPTGSMRVSSPETTVVDLVRFAKAAGHLDYVAAVVGELAPRLNARRLVAALKVVCDVPNAQRLGYILDVLRNRGLSKAVHDWVKSRIKRPQPLRPGLPITGAGEDRRWRLWINGPLEVEA